jgi:hypothetical protein
MTEKTPLNNALRIAIRSALGPKRNKPAKAKEAL